MTENKTRAADEELLKLLLEKSLLSGAQAEVARIDIASSGLSCADVLLTRNWITEETLAEIAQKVKADAPPAASDEQVYQQNLKKYRQLMAKIMGESD